MNLPDLPLDLAPRTVARVRSLMRLLALLAIVAGLAALPWSAQAATSNCSTSGGVISFGTVVVSSSQATGSVIAEVPVSMTFNCTGIPALTGNQGLYLQAGDLATRHSSDTGSGGIVFATSVAGVALKLTGSPFQPSSNACLRCGPGATRGFEIGPITSNGGSGSITENFTAQLIKTGTIAPGTLNTIRLMQFYWYEYGVTPSSGPMATPLQVSAAIVRTPTCGVNAGTKDFTVTLPTISVRSLPAPNGTTAGRTGFNLNLTCEAGVNTRVTLDSNRQHASLTGVVRQALGSGNANNVGVQILDSAFNPVPFDSARPVGISPSGAWQIPFYVQYYRLGAPGAGRVSATVTYTMTYN
ncbi:fimbrial protein [Lysobacter cavernae]|uniref:Fimbrial protein n=1 Tax=Lysobacter cavernae TaxID=1685901 RepID=A0ABV7RN06_9GAMM